MSSYREAEGRAILARLNDEETVAVAVDTETTGLKVAGGFDTCIGASIAGLFEDGTPFEHYFGIAHETGVNVSRETVEMLDWVLSQPRTLVFANAQFDILSMETVGIDTEMSDFIDICTMAHLVNENWPKNKGVDSLGKYYVDAEKVVDPFVEAEKKTGNKNITPEQMWEYAVQDAVITWRVWDALVDNPVWVKLPKTIWPNKQELIRVLLEMKRRGVRIDQDLAQEYVAKGEAEMKRLAKELGFPAIPKKPTKMYPDPDPDPLPVLGPKALEEIFLNKLELPVLKRGAPSKTHPEGRPSFDKAVMEEYDMLLERTEAPEAKLVTEYRGWQKAVSAAYRPYLDLVDPDGRLRCSYKTHGTVTGRFSCVSGDTILATSRGEFRFSEYQPVEGDLVQTHTGKWMPVLRKIYRGVDKAYRVRLVDGTELTATADHRVLTPRGWRHVGSLREGDGVYSVGVKEVRSGFGQCEESIGGIPSRESPNRHEGSSGAGDHSPQRSGNPDSSLDPREAESGAATSVLTLEDGYAKPDDREDRGETPQLHWDSVRREGVLAEEDGGGVRLPAPVGNGTSFGPHVVTSRPRRSSHRHEPAQQRAGQLGAGNEDWASSASPKVQRLEEHTYMGEIPVWDIEVAGDHSYVSGGLLSHNCSEPNLQQIPKTSDKPWNGKVKECFIAKDGYTLINADFSQLELRLGTAYAGEPELVKVFEEGRDIFTEMSEALDLTRNETKTLVYSMQYGAGLNRIMTVFGVSKARAKEIRDNYFNTYPLFKVLADRCAANAEAKLEVRLWNGRYRHFAYKSESFKAMNSVIQGGAADIVEAVMVRCFRELDNEDCRMLLQVHDSITWEVRTELVDEYVEKIETLMEDVSGAVGHDDFEVRFAVDVDYWTEREKGS